MRKINSEALQFYCDQEIQMREHFGNSANEMRRSLYGNDLALVEQLGISLLDELLIWGYQEKSLNPTFNRWQPDTCDCVIFYHFDPFIPQDQRIHIPANFGLVWHDGLLAVHQRKQCDFHKITDVAIHYAVVLGENQLKNRTLQSAFESIPTKFREEFVEEILTSADGRRRTRWIPAKRLPKSDTRQRVFWFKQGFEPQWSFDEARRLIIRFPGFIGEYRTAGIEVGLTLQSQIGDSIRVEMPT